MTFETRKAYSEVYAILQTMPFEYVNKIPTNLLNLFKNEKLKDYEVEINQLNPFDKKQLSRKAITIIAILNYQYWVPNKKVKDELYNIYQANNNTYQKRMIEKQNQHNEIKGKEIEKKEVKNNLVIVESKESYLTKILKKIKTILKK